MTILCVLDHFGSGGAQRQMVNLALGLKARGHTVEFFTYFAGHDFFRPLLDEAGIEVHTAPKTSRFSPAPLLALARLLRNKQFDAAFSFLNTPNLYLELSRLTAPSVPRIVSERSNHLDDRSPRLARLRRGLHRLADRVVVNSAAHGRWLAENHPWLREKIDVIWNGVEIARFAAPFTPPPSPEQTCLLVIGRVGVEKNVLGVVAALQHFRGRHGWAPQVTWVGRRADGSDQARTYLGALEKSLAEAPEIAGNLTFLGERNDIPQLLAQHHALMLPSFYEGLPNVVCEALAAGRPVVASRISDLPDLVSPGRGFLFDPHDSASISDAIAALVALEPGRWIEFSRTCREFAVENLSNERMVERFERLALSCKARERQA